MLFQSLVGQSLARPLGVQRHIVVMEYLGHQALALGVWGAPLGHRVLALGVWGVTLGHRVLALGVWELVRGEGMDGIRQFGRGVGLVGGIIHGVIRHGCRGRIIRMDLDDVIIMTG
ncbi:MAG: hypothetical protein E6Q84_02815 [Thiothrix sp.]|nr:MAG: hypothetical protein E6Q84_02815 [Thiothrix sp.]